MVDCIVQYAPSLNKVHVLQTVSVVKLINARCAYMEIFQFTGVRR